MRLTLPLLLLSSTALAFAAPSARAGGPAACNAKHKRPANLYGSVLAEGLKPVAAAAGSGGSAKPAAAAASSSTDAPTSGPSVKPPQVSRATLKASFAPCSEGDRT